MVKMSACDSGNKGSIPFIYLMRFPWIQNLTICCFVNYQQQLLKRDARVLFATRLSEQRSEFFSLSVTDKEQLINYWSDTIYFFYKFYKFFWLHLVERNYKFLKFSSQILAIFTTINSLLLTRVFYNIAVDYVYYKFVLKLNGNVFFFLLNDLRQHYYFISSGILIKLFGLSKKSLIRSKKTLPFFFLFLQNILTLSESATYVVTFIAKTLLMEKFFSLFLKLFLKPNVQTIYIFKVQKYMGTQRLKKIRAIKKHWKKKLWKMN